jgi:hypothetical protein
VFVAKPPQLSRPPVPLPDLTYFAGLSLTCALGLATRCCGSSSGKSTLCVLSYQVILLHWSVHSPSPALRPRSQLQPQSQPQLEPQYQCRRPQLCTCFDFFSSPLSVKKSQSLPMSSPVSFSPSPKQGPTHKKIVRHPPRNHRFTSPRRWIKLQAKFPLQSDLAPHLAIRV